MPVRQVIARVLAVAALTVGVLVAGPAPAATPAETKYANKIVDLVNNVRHNNDRAQLKRNKCLQRFANKQAQAMADQHRLFHQDLGRVQRACDVGWVGENVAAGPASAKQLVRLWMGSPPHKANILRRQFRITGVGARKDGGQWWVAQVFGRKS